MGSDIYDDRALEADSGRDAMLYRNVDVEQVYLGACMLRPEVAADSPLTPDDFENPKYGKVFDAMQKRVARGDGVSQTLMVELFPDLMRELWTATDALNEMLLWTSHERAIQGRATRRRLADAAVRVASLAKSGDVDTMVDEARAAVDIATTRNEKALTSMRDDVVSVLRDHRTTLNVVPSPWESLNKVIRGFAPGRMYVIGARPGVGKSAIATQIAYELANNGPCIIATLEMGKGEVYERIIAQQAQVFLGGMSDNMSEFLQAKENTWIATQLRDIRVEDAGTQTVASIRAAVRAAQRTGPVSGVVVDYIHLLSTPNRIENEVQRINEVTRTLKQMARDLHVPVIALSQLNREAAKRAGGRPAMEDLRGSGGIEQDADVIVFLYRDEASSNANADLGVYVAKNRQGENFVGFHLEWQGEFVRAVDPRPSLY